MSVLIKGENVPTSCRTCLMKMNCDDCEGKEIVCVPLHQRIGYWDDLLTDKRRGDCPLIPVPPHGRLIDADAIEELSKPRWIPVTERLPRMWEEVMLRFPNNQAVGFHDGDSGWAVFSGDNLYTYVAPEEVHPTHWMPLPEPPKEEEIS